MKRVELVAEGILYRNPNPGLKAECAYLPNLVSLSATELLCVYRIGSAFYSKDGRLAQLRSTDGGRTRWEVPRSTGIPGQTSWLADMGGGVFAAVYAQRRGMQPGIYVTLSTDEGNTWDIEHQVLVWDAVGQEYLGVEHKPSHPASHDNIALGKPNVTCLRGGEILCSWWCTQACVTDCRFAILNHLEY